VTLLFFKGLLLVTALCGFIYGFYCQTKARKYISKEKISALEDISILAHGPMPPKEVLSNQGLKYYQGFQVGMAFFVCSLIILVILSIFFGS
jgi:hypothetical protein